MKKKIATEEKDDDCAICRAMKEGRAGTEEGLLKAFAEAEKQKSGRMKSTQSEKI